MGTRSGVLIRAQPDSAVAGLGPGELGSLIANLHAICEFDGTLTCGRAERICAAWYFQDGDGDVMCCDAIICRSFIGDVMSQGQGGVANR